MIPITAGQRCATKQAALRCFIDSCVVRAACSLVISISRDRTLMVFSSYLQPRSFLEAPPPALLPDSPLKNQGVLAAECRIAGLLLAFALSPALGTAHRLLKQLAPQHVRQPHNPRAHCCAVAPVLALPPAACYLLGKVPQPRAYGAEGARRRVAGWLPLGCQA